MMNAKTHSTAFHSVSHEMPFATNPFALLLGIMDSAFLSESARERNVRVFWALEGYVVGRGLRERLRNKYRYAF